jgi:hypothetical protein
MSCGCTSPSEDCTEALTPIRTCTAQKLYGTTRSVDLVDGAALEDILERLVQHQNAISAALAQIMNEDCTLKDGVVRCANLAPEVGVSCLA